MKTHLHIALSLESSFHIQQRLHQAFASQTSPTLQSLFNFFPVNAQLCCMACMQKAMNSVEDWKEHGEVETATRGLHRMVNRSNGDRNM